MTVRHIGGTYADYTQAGTAAALTYLTDGTSYVSARARRALVAIQTTELPRSPAWSAVLNDFWFHTIVQSGGAGTTDVPIITFRDTGASPGPQLRISKSSTGGSVYRAQITTNGSTWTTIGSDFTLAAGTVKRLDIHVKFHASAGEILIYVDDTLAMTYSGAVVSQSNQCDQHEFSSDTTSAGSRKAWSETFVDTVSTVGCDVYSRVPTATGTNTAWTGGFADVDDGAFNFNDFVEPTATNDVVTYVVPDFTPSTTTLREIRAVEIDITGAKFTGTISDIQAAIIPPSGGIQYSSSLGFSGEVRQMKRALFLTNPVTSAAWSGVEANTIEIGMKAV